MRVGVYTFPRIVMKQAKFQDSTTGDFFGKPPVESFEFQMFGSKEVQIYSASEKRGNQWVQAAKETLFSYDGIRTSKDKILADELKAGEARGLMYSLRHGVEVVARVKLDEGRTTFAVLAFPKETSGGRFTKVLAQISLDNFDLSGQDLQAAISKVNIRASIGPLTQGVQPFNPWHFEIVY